MTDAAFQKILDKLSTALDVYRVYLTRAEEEYIKRFGYTPSEIDDDHWIDQFHVAGGASTVGQVTEQADISKSIYEEDAYGRRFKSERED